MSMPKVFSQLCFAVFLMWSSLLVADLQGQGRQDAGEAGTQNYQSTFNHDASSCGPDCSCGCKEGGVCNCKANGGCPASNLTAYEGDYATANYDDSTIVYNNDTDYNITGDDCECERPVGRIFNQHTVYEDTCPCATGIWLPEDPVLFRPLMADPRQITYSGGWRFNDQALVKTVIDVSFGDSIPFYRWLHVGPWDGQLQIDLEGALWAVFDPLHDSSPLINADYYGGIPITYAAGDWSFRLRGYHISCHIGDEFLLNHPTFERRNPSAEFLDFYASWDYTDELRFYAGIGVIVAQDVSFRRGRVYYEAGVEVRMPQVGFIDRCSQVYGMPIFAADFFHQTCQDKHINQTYVLGYEWGKLSGLQRKVRLFMEYHDGYSLEGQFCVLPTNYFSIRISYGY